MFRRRWAQQRVPLMMGFTRAIGVGYATINPPPEEGEKPEGGKEKRGGHGQHVKYLEMSAGTSNRLANMLKNISRYGVDEWVAAEKVHGTNFSIYLLGQHKDRPQFGKRTDMLPPPNHPKFDPFFGYQAIEKDLHRYAVRVLELLSEKLKVKSVYQIILRGEMFGGKYEHPKVPSSSQTFLSPRGPRTIMAVQKDAFPQYSPNLHFYAFDIEYRLEAPKDASDKQTKWVGIDDALDIFSKVDGLLYSKPLLRGPLAKIAAFDVERFETTLPSQIGLGPTPLLNNWAEGIVARHIHHGKQEWCNGMTGAPEGPKGLDGGSILPTLVKIKSTQFQELRHNDPNKKRVDPMEEIRNQEQKKHGLQMPSIESLFLTKKEQDSCQQLLDHVCDNRLNNVVSKIGITPLVTGEVSSDELVSMLAEDSMKDFLKDFADNETVTLPVMQRVRMAELVLFESRKLVRTKWKEFMEQGKSLVESEKEQEEKA